MGYEPAGSLVFQKAGREARVACLTCSELAGCAFLVWAHYDRQLVIVGGF